jgi:molybdopterin-binding protein
MPRKDQGWITFQASEEERQMLERICQQTQRTKTEVLREMLRNLNRSPIASTVEQSAPKSGENASSEEYRVAPSPLKAALPAMKLSARNIFQAKVKNIMKSSVNAEVTLAIEPGIEIVSTITSASADRLELVKGKEVFAVVKASSVMIAERSGGGM